MTRSDKHGMKVTCCAINILAASAYILTDCLDEEAISHSSAFQVSLSHMFTKRCQYLLNVVLINRLTFK